MNTANGTVHGEYKVPGGKLVVVDLSIVDGRMTAVQVSGDFFLEPARALDAIDAALEGLPADTGGAAPAAAVTATRRPGERSVGAACVSTFRSRGGPDDYKKNET